MTKNNYRDSTKKYARINNDKYISIYWAISTTIAILSALLVIPMSCWYPFAATFMDPNKVIKLQLISLILASISLVAPTLHLVSSIITCCQKKIKPTWIAFNFFVFVITAAISIVCLIFAKYAPTETTLSKIQSFDSSASNVMMLQAVNGWMLFALESSSFMINKNKSLIGETDPSCCSICFILNIFAIIGSIVGLILFIVWTFKPDGEANTQKLYGIVASIILMILGSMTLIFDILAIIDNPTPEKKRKFATRFYTTGFLALLTIGLGVIMFLLLNKTFSMNFIILILIGVASICGNGCACKYNFTSYAYYKDEK